MVNKKGWDNFWSFKRGKRNPVIYKHGEGKYVIDVASTFQLLSKKWLGQN